MSQSSGFSAGSLVNHIGHAHSTMKVGSYKGTSVAVKMLTKAGLTISRQDQMELKVVSNLDENDSILNNQWDHMCVLYFVIP